MKCAISTKFGPIYLPGAEFEAIFEEECHRRGIRLCITTACNAIEFIMAGASLVQVGTASFANSRGPIEVPEGTKDFPKKEEINRPTHVVGMARR